MPVTGWVSLGGGIYQGSCSPVGTTVNVALLNGAPQPLGRYPNPDAANGGFLNIDSHVTNTQITSSALNTAVNWAGAEVVIRKNHWILDRGTISSNTATVINYTDASPYSPTNNFGFFIQNSPNTLDQVGEWYYNPTTKMLSMYLGSTVPTNTSVQVSSTAYLVTIASKNYITVTGLAFIGANTHAFNITNSNYFKILNSTINGTGVTGVKAVTTTNLVVSNCSVLNSNNNGIMSTFAVGTTIINDTVKNAGAIAGMGQAGDGTYEGIVMNGKNGLIANNIVSTIGYDGLDFSMGDSTIVRNNYVSNFELVKEDGGGIYSYAANVDSNTNNYGRQIVGNIIANTIGAPNGASGRADTYACGIYLDANCTGITISGNSISSCLCGILVHESRNITTIGNTLFNNNTQLFFLHNTTNFATKNNVTNNNIIYSKYKTQTNLSMLTINIGVGTFGTFDNNYYSNSINNTFQINAAGKWLNLQLWQYLYKKDITSVIGGLVPYVKVVMPTKRSMFTNTAFNANINNVTPWSANGNFLGAWDNTGVLDGGSLKASFSVQSGAPNNNPSLNFKVGGVSTANIYMLKFTLKGTHSNRRIMVYLQNNSSPYNQVSPLQYMVLDSVRTENTIYITPTVACANTVAILRLENEDVNVWVDNFGFYQTNSTLIDPSTQIFYQYNATPASVNVKLSSSYIDIKNTIYRGTATIAPYSSLLLFKNADSTAIQPPIVYSAPTTSTDVVAISPAEKVAANIAVYPNPASDYFVFNFKNSDVKDLNIKLINTKGDVILNQNVQVGDNSYRLNLNQKPQPGCYFIKLSGSGINQTSKIIII